MTEQQSLDIDISGQVVKVSGVRGSFVVRGVNKDGSLAVFGGTGGKERHRSFPKDRVKFERKKK